MPNRFLIVIILFALSSCATRRQKRGFEDIADFGLSGDDTGVKVDDKAYFDDLKRSEASVVFESSLPLPFRVGKSGDPYDAPPALAKPSVESRLNVHMGSCVFTLLSGPVQVDRYLLAGQWIKLTEGLPAKVPVKLEPNQDLNIKAVSKLGVEVSETMVPVCRKIFEGRKVFLGRFHLNKSRVGFVVGPGSPNVVFGARSLDPQGKMVFLHWQSGTNSPGLIDDFDFPATAESGIFRAQMFNKGYYYLAFQTVLRMDQVDSMVIKLPLKGSSVVNTKAVTPAAQPAVAPATAAPSPGPMFAPTPSSTSPSKAGVAPAKPQTLPPNTPVANKPLPNPSPQAAGAGVKTPVVSHPAKALIPVPFKDVKPPVNAKPVKKLVPPPPKKKK